MRLKFLRIIQRCRRVHFVATTSFIRNYIKIEQFQHPSDDDVAV